MVNALQKAWINGSDNCHPWKSHIHQCTISHRDNQDLPAKSTRTSILTSGVVSVFSIRFSEESTLIILLILRYSSQIISWIRAAHLNTQWNRHLGFLIEHECFSSRSLCQLGLNYLDETLPTKPNLQWKSPKNREVSTQKVF